MIDLRIKELIDKLEAVHSLSVDEYEELIAGYSPDAAAYIAPKADALRRSIYGNAVYVRCLIEFTNFCKNDCLYCGIRRSNRSCQRYRLTLEQILTCCQEGYELGYRTFVLQGGEDPFFNDSRICAILSQIKLQYPDCAITLSIGEKSYESYQAYRKAGADRYLLRHETANRAHYEKLHPAEMSFQNRMNCLESLREAGFAIGAGFMVGSPYQTPHDIAIDLKYLETFQPEMCGIGPFIPHKDTPFHDKPAGTVELTLYCLSIIRLILPNVLLPATTALGTLDPKGREKGMQAGANVIMPNVSPKAVRDKYQLYDNKLTPKNENFQVLEDLKNSMSEYGYEIVVDRGDYKAP